MMADILFRMSAINCCLRRVPAGGSDENLSYFQPVSRPAWEGAGIDASSSPFALPIRQAFFALYSSLQFRIASKTGCKLYPNSVKVYATLGGTSGKAVRTSNPLSSICRSWEVSTFWLTLPMDLFNSPNLLVPDSKSRIISTFHLSLMYALILLHLLIRGQAARKNFPSGKKPERLEITQPLLPGNGLIVTFRCLCHKIVRTFQSSLRVV